MNYSELERNEAIKFAQWICKNQYLPCYNLKTWTTDERSSQTFYYSVEELYELFLKDNY